MAAKSALVKCFWYMGTMASIISSTGRELKRPSNNWSTLASCSGVASGTFSLKPCSAPDRICFAIPSRTRTICAFACIRSRKLRTSALSGASVSLACCAPTKTGTASAEHNIIRRTIFFILISLARLSFVVSSSSFVVQRLHPQEPRCPAQLLFNPQQLVVLRNSVGARSRSRLDLPRASRDRQIGDERVFGFAGTMRDHRRVSVSACQVDGVERFADRANLVEFDQD